MLNSTLNDYNLPYLLQLHPIAVHFVIAAVVISVIFDGLGFITRRQSFFNVGWWNLVIATVAILVAICLGQFEASMAVPSQATQPVLDRHMAIGWLLTLILVNLVLWRGVLRYHIRPRISLFYLSAGLLTVALVAYQVVLGTQLVWVHGLHVKPAIEALRATALEIEALEYKPTRTSSSP